MTDDSSIIDGMVIFQERVVNLLQQLKMPIFETSLVFQKHINQLMKTLQEFALSTGQHIPDKIGEPWAIDVFENSSTQ